MLRESILLVILLAAAAAAGAGIAHLFFAPVIQPVTVSASRSTQPQAAPASPPEASEEPPAGSR